MIRFPGKSKRASMYAHIEPSSITRTSAVPTTKTVLRKKEPIPAVVQALE